MFKSWFGRIGKDQPSSALLLQSIEFARILAGRCVYAIGDIHGRADLFRQILLNISKDIAHHGFSADIVILGDMIDRGPDSRAVLELILQSQVGPLANATVTLLKGNHEEMLLQFLSEPEDHGPFWFRNGGLETLQSYGVHPPKNLSGKQWNFVRDEFVDRIPKTHMEALKQLLSKLTIDDYFFCHASIKEGQGLGQQREEDLLWSRRFPTDDWGPQEKIIVHGHQPVSEPLMERFHINVDTGAYASGRLTCVKLSGGERKFMQVSSAQKNKI